MDNHPPGTSKSTDPDPEDLSDSELEPILKQQKPLNMSPGVVTLRSWLNKTIRVAMSDGRVLIGIFLCTDRDGNMILGSCSELLPEEVKECASNNPSNPAEEPRMLGLVMVPGIHIVSILLDQSENIFPEMMGQTLTSETSTEDAM